MDKLDGKSMDLVSLNIEKLKGLFPEVVTEGKIDFEKLQLVLGENIETKDERYEFTWNGKSQAIRLANKPSTGTLRPDKKSSKNWDTTENLYIEGDNLEVLKLLQKNYFNKVKMIYIDPPYNTGNDFVYHDDFRDNVRNYKEITSQTAKSNAETSGRYHTDWLNMMYPRLRLARNLLRDDGVIFISIDDNECANLRKICDEVYGEENFRNYIIVRRYDKNLNRQFIESGLPSMNVGVEYVLVYTKDVDTKLCPVFRTSSEQRSTYGYWKGFWNAADRPTMRYKLLGVTPESGQWKWKKEVADEAVENYREYVSKYASKMSIEEYWQITGRTKKFIRRNMSGKGKNIGVEHWVPPSDGILRNSNWSDTFASKDPGFNIPFDNPKNMEMIVELCKLSNVEDSGIILDFFAGSSTTAQAVMQLNAEDSGCRKFIMVQLPELCNENSEASKVGYKNVFEIGKDRISRAGEKIKEENRDKQGIENLDTGFKVFKLDTSNIKEWDVEDGNLKRNLLNLINSVKEDRNVLDILYEVMIKLGLDLNSPIEEIKILKKKVFSVGLGYLMACFDENIGLDLIDEIGRKKPEVAVFLDKSFESDVVKTNAYQRLKKYGVKEIKSI